METVSAERIVLEAGRSAALDRAFRTIAETDLGAGPKYGPRTLASLAGVISTRAYGLPLLELCHLIRVAEMAGGRHGWTGFFFGLRLARPGAFRGSIDEALGHGGRPPAALLAARTRVDGHGITLVYDDQPFTVTFGRMPFLAALLDFLVTHLGYRQVSALFEPLFEASFRIDAVTAVSRALSRVLYDSLREDLPSVQHHRVCRRLVRALSRRGGGSFRLDDIDDAFVLDHWLGAADDPETAAETAPESRPETEEDRDTVRTFRRLAEQVAHFRAAYEAGLARRAFDRPLPIGADRSAGEIDPDALLAVVETHDGGPDPLLMLSEDPARRVKFLNRRETERMESLRALGPQAPALPLTALRIDVFAPAQARLVQAARDRVGGAALAEMIACRELPDYREAIDGWRTLVRHLRRVGLAALAILVEARRPEALLEAAERTPGFDLRSLRPPRSATDTAGEGVVVPFPAGAGRSPALADLVPLLDDADRVGPEVHDLLKTARAALRGLSRVGFAAADRRDPGIVDGLAAGAPAVRLLQADLDGLAARVAAVLEAAGARRFEQDRDLFVERFRVLYGTREAGR